MKKSPQAVALDTLHAALATSLKAKGFRKNSRTFNRSTADDLTQVINLQMGASDPPGTTYIPGLRENLYGLFTVNLGVYVPEVARFHLAGEPKGFIREYNCCVRARLGDLGPEGRDLWWAISENRDLIDAMQTRIHRDGLPFLERYGTRDAIVATGRVEGANLGAGGPPRIAAAIILACRGEVDAARALLARQMQECQNPGHPAYLRALAERLGIPDLEKGPEST